MDRLLSMRVFERVVDEEGFAAAARALDMSPPVVTRLVADLESHLGTRLLQRTTRRLSLTDAGQAYLLRVRSILEDIEEADAIASADTQELQGLLRLHAPPVLATYVIAPLLAGFRLLYPKITIELEAETLREPPVEDFDITMLGTDASFDANVVARRVMDSKSILVASPVYLQRRGVPLMPQDLAAHDCLRLKTPHSRTTSWHMWPEHDEAQAQTVEVTPVLQANHTDTLMRATLDGAGITSIPMDMAAPLLVDGDLVRVLHPWITGRLSMYAALPSRKFIPQRTQVFLDYLVEQTRKQSVEALAACEACDA